MNGQMDRGQKEGKKGKTREKNRNRKKRTGQRKAERRVNIQRKVRGRQTKVGGSSGERWRRETSNNPK